MYRFYYLFLLFLCFNFALIAQSSNQNDNDYRVKRNSPLIGYSEKELRIKNIDNNFIFGLRLENNMSSILQDVDPIDNDLIYDSWSALDGTHYSFGPEFRVRFSQDPESILSKFWLILGFKYSEGDFKAEKANNKLFLAADGNFILVDHDLTYTLSYFNFDYGLAYSFNLSDKINIQPKFVFNILSPYNIDITQTDVLETPGYIWSNGQQTQTGTTTTITEKNLIYYQIGADVEYILSRHFSVFFGITSNFSTSKLIADESFSDRTLVLDVNSDIVTLSNREFERLIGVSVMLNYKF